MSMHSKAEPSRAHGARIPHGSGLRLLLFFPLALILLCTGCATKQAANHNLENPVVTVKGDESTLLAAARSKIGVPYRFGGNSPETGFDCSGFVCWTYEQVGVKLPRRASDQVAFGTPVERRDLKPGDIVAFKGTRGRTNWHSGIYTGNGKFIHSPNKGKTVTESSLSEEYYDRRFYGACRIPTDGSAGALYAAYLEKEKARALSAKAGKQGKTAVAKARGGKSQGKAIAKAKGGSGKTVAAAKSGASSSKTAAKSAPKSNKKSKKSGKSAAAPEKTKTAAASSPARKDKKL